MKVSYRMIVWSVMLGACALSLSSGCRRSTIRLDSGEKLRARVLNSDQDNVYVVTRQKQVRAVARHDIETHRPPGGLTMTIGGLYAVIYGGALLGVGQEDDPQLTTVLIGVTLGAIGVLVTGGVIRHQALKRYRRGLQIKDVVTIEPVLGTGAVHQAGVRVRF